jgi:hypothetical protein
MHSWEKKKKAARDLVRRRPARHQRRCTHRDPAGGGNSWRSSFARGHSLSPFEPALTSPINVSRACTRASRVSYFAQTPDGQRRKLI